MLKDKTGLWKSVDSWTFKTKGDDLIYVENTSKTKVLGATSNGKVIQEVSVEGKANQLWKKGKPDAEDYFTLENSGELKVLTAISESGLEIKGNITLRWILINDYCLVHPIFLSFSFWHFGHFNCLIFFPFFFCMHMLPGKIT